MCCGQAFKPVARRLVASREPEPPPRKTPPKPPQPGDTALRYRSEGLFALRGPRTGRVYRFDAQGEPTPVAAEDLEALLLTRLFQKSAQ
jgi:hypothetical protein